MTNVLLADERLTMKKIVVGIALVALAAGSTIKAQELQQKLAAAKQAAALNQKALRSYSWLEKTELRLKGELKATKVDMCKYGPDGTVLKTPVVDHRLPWLREGERRAENHI